MGLLNSKKRRMAKEAAKQSSSESTEAVDAAISSDEGTVYDPNYFGPELMKAFDDEDEAAVLRMTNSESIHLRYEKKKNPAIETTFLDFALMCEMYEVAKKCIELGADVNADCSPLRTALTFDNIEMAQLLIAHGADVLRDEPKWHWWNTRQLFCVQSLAGVKLVLESEKASELGVIHYKDSLGYTILFDLMDSCKDDDDALERFKYLVEKGVDVLCINTFGYTVYSDLVNSEIFPLTTKYCEEIIRERAGGDADRYLKVKVFADR